MENTNKIKIFLTGGTGFIGRHLLADFAEEDFLFFVLTHEEVDKNSFPENITFFSGEIFEIERFADILDQCTAFIHMAGEKRNKELMYRINVEGTKTVLQEIVKHPSISYIHISSSGIYGIHNHSENEIKENEICIPGNAYEMTKFQSEQVVFDFAKKYNLRYVILRPSNVFGENDYDKKLLKLMQQIKKNRFVILEKHGNVNYVYVKYLTGVIKEIINKNKYNNTVYNVNSPMNIYEFINGIYKNLDLKTKIKITPILVKHVIFLISKFCDLLPSKIQIFNSKKYIELTNKKIYSVTKIRQESEIDIEQSLFTGIQALVKFYKEKGWL